MAKKKINSNNELEKKNSLRQLFRENKGFFGTFILLFSTILVLSSTFAWSSYSSWVRNHMQTEATQLDVRIEEDFKQDSLFEIKTPTTKIVNVRNVSTQNAITRVRIQENAIFFEVDESTGDLVLQTEKELPQGKAGKYITPSNLGTWQFGEILESKIDQGETKYHIAKKKLLKKTYGFSEADKKKRLPEFKPYQLNFNKKVKDTITTGETEPFWYYEEGYFYYSRVLEPGELTQVSLLESVQLTNPELANELKNQLYHLNVEAYGLAPNDKSLEKWEATATIKDLYVNDPLYVREME